MAGLFLDAPDACVENDLYTIDPKGTKSPVFEETWLTRVDSDGASAIRIFEKGLHLTNEWKESFSMVIAQQYTRSPSYRDMVIQSLKALDNEVLRQSLCDPERTRAFLKHYGIDRGEKFAESLVDDYLHGRVKVDDSPTDSAGTCE